MTGVKFRKEGFTIAENEKDCGNFLKGFVTGGFLGSNDAKALLGAPSFSAASFQYDGGTIDLTISLHY
jgi:uncharacterized protein (DUF2141 family)